MNENRLENRTKPRSDFSLCVAGEKHLACFAGTSNEKSPSPGNGTAPVSAAHSTLPFASNCSRLLEALLLLIWICVGWRSLREKKKLVFQNRNSKGISRIREIENPPAFKLQENIDIDFSRNLISRI